MPNATPMRAIETRYAGHLFRSRLEARWAVCFDALGIPWEYEPEGYWLDNGPYLPDFRLWGQLHVEVKPVPSLETRESFYEDLLRRVDGMDKILVLVGQPRVTWYPVVCIEPQALMWIDLDRSSMAEEPKYFYSETRPQKEDLAWPHLRFERAVLAAAFERFESQRRRTA